MITIFLLEDLYDRYGDRDGYKLVAYGTGATKKDCLAKIAKFKETHPKCKFVLLEVL